jgi:hypothetical protein
VKSPSGDDSLSESRTSEEASEEDMEAVLTVVFSQKHCAMLGSFSLVRKKAFIHSFVFALYSGDQERLRLGDVDLERLRRGGGGRSESARFAESIVAMEFKSSGFSSNIVERRSME